MFLIYLLIYGNLFIYGFTTATTESVGAVCLGSCDGLAVFMPAPCLPHCKRTKKKKRKKNTKHLASSPSNTALYTTSLKQECMCVVKGWLAIYRPELWLVLVCMKLIGCTQAEALGQISNSTICLLPKAPMKKGKDVGSFVVSDFFLFVGLLLILFFICFYIQHLVGCCLSI